MTEILLIETSGSDVIRALLDEDAPSIHHEMRPHDEVAAPIPEGIFPAFPDPDDTTTPDVLPSSIAALAATFHMPLADDA